MSDDDKKGERTEKYIPERRPDHRDSDYQKNSVQPTKDQNDSPPEPPPPADGS